MKLAGKKIVITGGSGTIGSLIARIAVAQGAIPLIVDRSMPQDTSWKYIEGDLSTFNGVINVSHQLITYQPDILLNLAGIQFFGTLEMQEPQHIATMYQINLLAPILLTQALLPDMKKRGSGQIVNIGSIFGSIPFAHFVNYSTTKAGIKAFSEALRREVSGTGITVTHIAPRSVRTPLNDEKVMKLATRTKMNMDEPDAIANRIVKAILREEKDVYIGFPESLFVRINALLPRLVDSALIKNDRIAKEILTTI